MFAPKFVRDRRPSSVQWTIAAWAPCQCPWRVRMERWWSMQRRSADSGGEKLWELDGYCFQKAMIVITRWWFQTFFIFTPTWWRFSFLTNIFQMGWNHQPDYRIWWLLLLMVSFSYFYSSWLCFFTVDLHPWSLTWFTWKMSPIKKWDSELSEIIMASGFRFHSLKFGGVVGWAFFFKQLIYWPKIGCHECLNLELTWEDDEK